MLLTLHLPGLLLPEAIRTDTLFDLQAPSLSLLLGRARREEQPGNWLAKAFDHAGPLPSAALRKVGAGGTASGQWLCLDPVHFAVSREGIHLQDPDQLALRDAEAEALLAAVTPVFASFGELSASCPAHWEIRLAQPLTIETIDLPEAIGRAIDPMLPGGPDGRALRRALAEVQTLLHAHPVNRNRDALNQPTVSSLWPWGLGSLPASVSLPWQCVWSADPVISGLCALAGTPCLLPPEGFQLASGNVLAIVPTLASHLQARDVHAWRDTLIEIDKHWLKPAITAVKRGECGELRVVASGSDHPGTVSVFSLKRGDLWRFWRRPRPLTGLGDPGRDKPA